MKIRHRARPVGVNSRHIHPRHEGARERVQQPLGGFVDLGDAQDVVDVGDDGQALRRHQVRRRVSRVRALRVDVEALDRGRAVAGLETRVVDREEGIEVAFWGCRDGEFDDLIPAGGGDGAAASGFARGAGGWRGGEREGEVLVGLLEDEDFGGEVAGLGRLRGGE